MKFTPGPWEREVAQDGEYTGPGDNPPGYAGDYYETNHVGHLDTENGIWTPVADCYRGGDARLITFAPEMYESLSLLVTQFIRDGKLTNEAVIQAQEALAKAEGRDGREGE